jgi:hypothetical protein
MGGVAGPLRAPAPAGQTQSASLARAARPIPGVLALQRQVGNAAVTALLGTRIAAQRDEDEAAASDSQPAGPGGGDGPQAGESQVVGPSNASGGSPGATAPGGDPSAGGDPTAAAAPAATTPAATTPAAAAPAAAAPADAQGADASGATASPSASAGDPSAASADPSAATADPTAGADPSAATPDPSQAPGGGDDAPFPADPQDGGTSETDVQGGVQVTGNTHAAYSHSYAAQGDTVSGQTHTGTLAEHYAVTTKVTLPSPPGDATACEKPIWTQWINTTLAAHEQQHVDAFHTYDGDTSTPYSVTGGIDQLGTTHAANAKTRQAGSDQQSAALDPFNVDVDLSSCDSGS